MTSQQSFQVLVRDENALFYQHQPVSFHFNQTGTILHVGHHKFRTKRLQVLHGLGRHELVLFTPGHTCSIRPTESARQEWNKVKTALRLLSISPNSFFYTGVLGKGRFGTVYLARTRHSGMEVAVKEVHKSHLKAASFPLSFARREQQVLSVLPSHPNIVSILDAYESKTSLFTVMECINGCTLAALLERRALTQDEINGILTQLLLAVKHMHYNKVLHRDLKLENILIKRDDNYSLAVKVCDFGLALNTDHIEDADRMGKVGTGYTQAPELSLEEYLKQIEFKVDTFNAAVATPVDMWACGIILFTILYRRLPFDDHPEKKAVQMKKMIDLCIEGKQYLQVIQTPDERIRTPQRLHKVLSGLLHPDPAKRLSADDAMEILQPTSEMNRSNGLSSTETQNSRRISIRDAARRVVSLLRVIQRLKSPTDISLPHSAMMFM